MPSSTTNLASAGIKNAQLKESRASLNCAFSISDQLEMIGYLSFRKTKEEIKIENRLWNTHIKTPPSLINIVSELKNYPEAKEYLKEQSLNCSVFNSKLEEKRKEFADIIYRKASKEDEEFWTDFTNGMIDPLISRNNYIIRRNSFILSKNKQSKEYLNVIKAKSFPITDLMEFKGRITHCIFHNEKTPSLYYYPDTNSVYCFSCHTYGDAIKVYQQINNCSFIEAVKALQK